MTGHKHSHFQNQDPLHHVIDARRKGKLAANEIHGEELSGQYSAAGSSAKQTALIIIILLSIFTNPIMIEPKMLLSFLFGWLIWKTGSSAILGWRRLERLHRLIEEERWEIEHHRPQEKEELTALYAAKGFSGKQLEEVITVLMADDNRLLQIMLEEELGLSLEAFEHPLKQAIGAAAGTIIASALVLFGLFILPFWGSFVCAGIAIGTASGLTAHFEKNQPLPAIVWNLASAALAVGCTYFMGQLLIHS
jgi:hypothetical protein